MNFNLTTEQQLIKQAKGALETALKASNDFFTNDWKPYTNKMKTIALPRFKTVETIQIN